MNRLFLTALSALLAVTLVVQVPSQAHAGAKERAMVKALVAGAAAKALAIAANSKLSKGRGFKKASGFKKRTFYANDDCGTGSFIKRGKCKLRSGGFSNKGISMRGFKISKTGGGKSKKLHTAAASSGKKKYSKWQLAAIRKGCKPGLAWSKQEGCHEND